ncbi:MAG: hypothetical protein CM1200mP2_20460 [Planctomycetaceae bacterium]|nr:MAG: hypothetical protein CM1200mP2_20460 [Planctomycetaceae bacterium]
MLHRCLDVGINFFDSAEAYSWGESEKLLGRVIKGRRDKVVICTKAAPSLAPVKDPKTNKFKLGQPVSFTRKILAQKCEGSLRRLGTDHLDLFLLHDDDGKTPPAEIAESMDRLVKAGKVRYWGLSNFSAASVRRYASLPRQNSRSRVSGTEDYFHIAAGLRMPTDLLKVVGNAGWASWPSARRTAAGCHPDARRTRPTGPWWPRWMKWLPSWTRPGPGY